MRSYRGEGHITENEMRYTGIAKILETHKYRLYELVEGGVATDIVIDTVADTCFHKNGVLSLWKAPQCVYSPLFRAISLKHQPIQHQP